VGQPIGEAIKHRSDVSALRFDHAGKVVLTAARDATAALWDAQTGLSAMEPMRHGQIVIAAAFARDERTVLTVSGGEGKPAQLQRWDITRDAYLQNVLPHDDRVAVVALHPDGQHLATGSPDGSLRIWNTTNRTISAGPVKRDAEISSCAFSSTGTVLAASAGNMAFLWDAFAMKPLAPPVMHQGAVTSVGFSTNGKTLLTTSLDGTARLWDAADGKPLGIVLQHDDAVLAASFSPEGQRILTGSSDKTARLWDARTGQLLGSPMTHQAAVSFVRFSPDGRTVATGSKDGTVRLWNALTAEAVAPTLSHDREVTGIVFSADSRTLATAVGEVGGQGSARVWDVRSGQPLTDAMVHPDGVTTLALHPDGHRLATGSFDGILRVWDYRTARQRFASIRFESTIVHLDYSTDGRQLIVASGNGVTLIDLIDPEKPAPEWLISLGERVGGLRLNLEGVLEPVAERSLNPLRDALNRDGKHDEYTRFGHWFFSPPAKSARPISEQQNQQNN